MTVAARPLLDLDSRFARELPELAVPWQGAQAPAPRALVVNEALAAELGADPEALRAPEGVAVLAGSTPPEGARPVAQIYAGHQFGAFVPRLGDGRALLLGEATDVHGRLRDVHLKGSGRTPLARGADGKAAVGPMLREWVIGEAMHALGIPTTRALAVVATGEQVWREAPLPGAVLARVAASHIRVGSFQYLAARGDRDVLRRLADHAIARHHPAAAQAELPYLAFYEAVVEAQASLLAGWMLVGFVHGVMNTDNMAVSGETIDYGPCAFLDAYDPAAVFSSIDHGGRYAYRKQPGIAQWDLARLAEALLPLIDDDTNAAVAPVTEVLGTFPARYEGHLLAGLRAKFGLAEARDEDAGLAADWLATLAEQGADFTASFRELSSAARGDATPARARFADPGAFDAWAERWRARHAAEGRDPAAVAAGMDRANPAYIPRNHLVEEALTAATAGDLAPVRELVEAVSRPFEARPGLERHGEPAPAGCGPYVTYCGT